MNDLRDWKEDCIHWMGRELTGKKSHWCPEWDDLPIDETCPEIECCLCYPEEEECKKP